MLLQPPLLLPQQTLDYIVRWTYDENRCRDKLGSNLASSSPNILVTKSVTHAAWHGHTFSDIWFAFVYPNVLTSPLYVYTERPVVEEEGGGGGGEAAVEGA